MPPFGFLLFLLALPFRIIYELCIFYIKGSPYRKYSKQYLISVQISFCQWLFDLPVTESRYFSLYNASMISSFLGFKYSSILGRYPGHGEPYDDNSFWLRKAPNRKSTDPILIYLHGGGYCFQLGPSQYKAVVTIVELLDASKRENLSVLIFDYNLASSGFTFPSQLAQFHDTYQKLTVIGSNSNIILMGDSAGGNLALVYLQYLKDLQQKNSYSAQGVVYPSKLVLISPWVKIQPEPEDYRPGHSYYDNDTMDLLRYEHFSDSQAIRRVFGTSDLDSLTVSPGRAPLNKLEWSGITSINDENSDILVIVGEDEVFRDDVLDWCHVILDCPLQGSLYHNTNSALFIPAIHEYKSLPDKGTAGVEVFVEPWGVHDATFLFEDDLLDKIDKLGLSSNVNAVDSDTYFGTYRIVQFLNRVL
ncbi:hypothetical protein CAAN1_01S11980 [[Candida] anglica]|uniref:Alpha/beta hydrolase fold-3 domain-containing protein n=1 Tax=[Candida] anglica TaxID=148631 RepID=A0ABP0EN68_9ASCO